MKKIILFIAASFALLSGLSAQITQEEADRIVFERVNQGTVRYTVYAKEGLQTNMTITTRNGEELELDYPCWVYFAQRWFNPFVNYVMAPDCCSNRYLIVKESNGNLLEVKTQKDAIPENWESWKMIQLELGTYTETSGAPCISEITFLDNEKLVMRGNSLSEEEYQYFDYKISNNGIDLTLENNPTMFAYFRIINSRKFEIQYLCPHTHMGMPPAPLIFEKMDIASNIITIGYQQTYDNTEEKFKLQLDSVSDDSRCAINANCAWEGDVKVHFNLISNENSNTKFTLNLNPKFRNDTVINNLHFKLWSVTPHPELGKEIEQKDYVAKVLVTPFIADQSNCDQDVIISSYDEYENAPGSYVNIINMKIVDDCLKIKFSASGCSGNSWVVNLIAQEGYAKSLPPQRSLKLSLDNKEMCTAVFSKEISFNIKDLQIEGTNKVWLDISGSSILYEYDSNEVPYSFVQIGKGELYGNGDEGISKQNLVITDKAAWDNLLTVMNSGNNVSNNFTETEIDFSKYQIVAVFEEVKGSGGWSIDITNVAEYKDKIVVTMENLEKGNAATVMTQPFHIVKIPASDKKIVFEEKSCKDTFCTENLESISIRLKYPDGQPVLLDSCKVFWVNENRYLGQEITSWKETQIYGSYVIVSDIMQKELQNRQETMRFTGYLNGKIVCERDVLVGANCCHVKYLGTEPLTQIIQNIPDDVKENRFCALVNVEHIREIIPAYNAFVETIDKNLPYESKLQKIVDWFNSRNCITDAHIDCTLCEPTHPNSSNNSKIAFSFVENGQTVNMIMLASGDDGHFAGLISK